MIQSTQVSTERSEKHDELPYVSPGELESFQKAFFELGIVNNQPYPGADQFTRNMQRAGVLRYDGVEFRVSGNTLSPFKR